MIKVTEERLASGGVAYKHVVDGEVLPYQKEYPNTSFYYTGDLSPDKTAVLTDLISPKTDFPLWALVESKIGETYTNKDEK